MTGSGATGASGAGGAGIKLAKAVTWGGKGGGGGGTGMLVLTGTDGGGELPRQMDCLWARPASLD